MLKLSNRRGQSECMSGSRNLPPDSSYSSCIVRSSKLISNLLSAILSVCGTQVIGGNHVAPLRVVPSPVDSIVYRVVDTGVNLVQRLELRVIVVQHPALDDLRNNLMVLYLMNRLIVTPKR
jgi:hypothetical protein